MALEQFARYKVPKFQSSLEVFGRFEQIDPVTDDSSCQVYLPDKINEELLAKMGAPTSSSSFGAVSLEDKFSALPMPNRSEGGEEASSECRVKFLHGTTTLAFKYRNGVVVATDSRASAGGYIASSTVKKIIEIDARLVGTMAGGAADCLFWERNLARYCRLYALRNRAPISVAAASKFLSNMLYQYRGMGLSVGTMISGYDKTGPGLFYVDDDGVRFTGTLFSVGSGSPYAYGVLDQGWRWDLTDDEAFELAQRSIYHATFRDAGSGGFVRIYHIGPNGWRPISLKDVQIIHEERERDEKLELAAVPARA